jgi:hypothetical protein
MSEANSSPVAHVKFKEEPTVVEVPKNGRKISAGPPPTPVRKPSTTSVRIHYLEQRMPNLFNYLSLLNLRYEICVPPRVCEIKTHAVFHPSKIKPETPCVSSTDLFDKLKFR